ncbi:unnamed protein product [Cylindrotheca closterium]|uniref:Uncharacterized protein n=1 Tax=Cylindrotheca closterium TaxID=2856 RepID=A0AAD2JL99_9STRA|nr:unnamed protein product [Cylindrotheca closterium]
MSYSRSLEEEETSFDWDSLRSSRYYPHESESSSMTTSVTIRVTPEHYYLVSWSILWGGFLLAILAASIQVHIENEWLHTRRQDIEQGNPSGDEQAISSADVSRSRFRRLLLLALVTRAVMMPIHIWRDPLWVQFIADTLPQMAFASAWTLLVSFFVQLVGVAQGTATSASPGIVAIQLTACVVYVSLVVTFFFNVIAAVLMYALFCCMYSALFGTTMYFCPKLLTLLRPSLSQHSGLAIRLAFCSVLCLFVFGFSTFGFARKVVAPPHQILWWWNYGFLELIPSVLFLIMMRPNSNRSPDSGAAAPDANPPAAIGRRGRGADTVPFINKSPAATGGYGSVQRT